MKASTTHNIRIYQDGGRWKADAPDNGKVKPHHELTWTVEGSDVVAHLQFAHPAPNDPNKCFLEGTDADWGFKVEAGIKSGPLYVRPGVAHKHYHYAAWITPANVWVIGDNPPPKIDVDRP